jgi:hypothetical protein
MGLSTLCPDKRRERPAQSTISQIKLNIDSGVTVGKPVVMAAFATR